MTLPQKITLIAAIAQNRCIGSGNALPWHIPEDFAFFKRCTLGRPVIMGRKTWESLPKKPLPKRRNIVLTRQKDFAVNGAQSADSLQAALALCAADKEVMIIGGAEIYAAALPLATDMLLTEVYTHIDGDAFFPQWDKNAWLETGRAASFSEKENLRFDWVHYRRIKAA